MEQLVAVYSSWNVSLIPRTSFPFDLSTPQCKPVASLMAALAEFERNLLKERITLSQSGRKGIWPQIWRATEI